MKINIHEIIVVNLKTHSDGNTGTAHQKTGKASDFYSQVAQSANVSKPMEKSDISNLWTIHVTEAQ